MLARRAKAPPGRKGLAGQLSKGILDSTDGVRVSSHSAPQHLACFNVYSPYRNTSAVFGVRAFLCFRCVSVVATSQLFLEGRINEYYSS